MRWQKAILLAGIAAGTIFHGGLYAEAAEAPQAAAVASVQGIEQVTVISKSYGDGELPAYVVLKYPHSLDSKQLAAADYTVEGRTVEKVTTNTEPTAEKDVPGCYVVLHLAHSNTSFDGDLAARAKQDAAQAGQADAAGDDKGGKGVDAPWIADRQPPDLTVKVSQVKDVKAQDGTVYAASSQAHSDSGVVEQDVDRFTQHVYKDPETGYEMPYNLYLPKDYDPNKSYPLVFFVADASANINNTKTPLFQGNGATVWTEPEEQAKHPCIVLAPQYTQDLVQSIGMMTTDENVWTPGLTLVTHLLQDTIKNYAVDKTRIYGTGQSQGGMTNIAISDRYPDLFAAQWLVACQWNVQEMAAMKDKKLWITVCEGDNKAFPGMNEATALWESLGSSVARNASPWWNSKSPVAELDKQVRELAAQGKKINYTVFAGGNHMYTWSFAYGIDAIRDWLFAQKK